MDSDRCGTVDVNLYAVDTLIGSTLSCDGPNYVTESSFAVLSVPPKLLGDESNAADRGIIDKRPARGSASNSPGCQSSLDVCC